MKKWLVGMVAGLLLATNVMADTIEDKTFTASEHLESFITNVETFSADFEQIVLDPKGQKIDTAQGKMLLARPGKFSWIYSAPYPQQIIADGDNIWFYDEDLMQVTVKPQSDALMDTPAMLLSGKGLPTESYDINNIPSDDEEYWVRLVPKDTEAGYQQIVLVFSEGGSLYQMFMRDSFDQTTQLTFTNSVENKILATDAFVFETPEGVDVVGAPL